MRVALAVNHVVTDICKNISHITELVGEAASKNVDLIVFPETAITGLITNHDPKHDLPLGMTIPGETVNTLAALAKRHSIWLAIGIFERDENRLFDTALLFTDEGDLALKYRRVQPNWHTRDADPIIYCQGNDFPKVITPFGSIMFLICGDLWDDDIVERARKNQVDYLLYPFARAFEDESWNQHKWDTEEMNDYADRINLIGCTAFMTNYLSKGLGGWSDGCFGGAWIVNSMGKVTHQFPIGQTGLLIADLESRIR